MLLPRWLVILIALLVCTMWTANIIVGYFAPDRAAPGVNILCGLVVGSVFTLDNASAVRKRLSRLITPPAADDPTTAGEGGGPQ